MTVWSYDIETADWSTFVRGTAYDGNSSIIFKREEEAAEWYRGLSTRDEVLAHNGGAFDFIQLIGATPDLSWSATMAGGNIVSCRAKGGALCRDTKRLFPLSLSKWTGRKDETGLECKCGEDCGGYCSISLDLPPAKMRRLEEYMVNDAVVLWDQWHEDVPRLEADGLIVQSKNGIRGTIGGVSWATAATIAGLPLRSPPEWDDYDAGRAAYYGGRCEVGQIEADRGYRYDVHAMYPWALTFDVPTGERRSYTGAAARRAYARHELGLYGARVRLPDDDLPALPHRYQGGDVPPTRNRSARFSRGRMLWATGVIEGFWSGVELRAAERHGAVIEDITHADVWSSQAPIFKPYVEMIYAARRRALESCPKGNPPKCKCDGCRWGAVIKWFANSLTGKLGQRASFSDLTVCAAGDRPLENWDQLGGNDSRVYARTRREVPASGLTWAAATLTARARVKLLDRLARHRGRWLYCDTDSTYLLDRDGRDVHESKLGTFGYEGEAIDWHAMAPKLYRYRDEKGKAHVRARGVPRATWAKYDTLREGGHVTVSGPARIRSSGGRFKRRDVTRSHLDVTSGWVGTRRVTRDGTGQERVRTRPLRRERDGRYV